MVGTQSPEQTDVEDARPLLVHAASGDQDQVPAQAGQEATSRAELEEAARASPMLPPLSTPKANEPLEQGQHAQTKAEICTEIISERVMNTTNVLCSASLVLLCAVLAYGIAACITASWYPFPFQSSSLPEHVWREGRTGWPMTGHFAWGWASPSVPSVYCGIETEPETDTEQLKIHGRWLFKDLVHGNRSQADARGWLYSSACYNISAVDVVGTKAGQACKKWCDEHVGNFTYNLMCNLPLGFRTAPVLAACFKAEVALGSSSVSPLTQGAMISAYATGSALFGYIRFARFKSKDPTWHESMQFQTSEETWDFLKFSMTQGRIEWLKLRKALFAIMFDILGDLVGIVVLLKKGEPFFAFGLLAAMLAFFGKDDIFQSVGVTEWLLSDQAGFPTLGLLQKIAKEGREAAVSGFISVYILMVAPLHGFDLSSTFIFLVSLCSSSVCCYNGFEAGTITWAIQLHPEAARNFDLRIQQTSTAKSRAALRLITSFAKLMAWTLFIVRACTPGRGLILLWTSYLVCWTLRAILVLLWRLAGNRIAAEVESECKCAVYILLQAPFLWCCIINSPRFYAGQDMTSGAQFGVAKALPWWPAVDVTEVPLDQAVLALVKVVLLWACVLSHVGCIIRLFYMKARLNQYMGQDPMGSSASLEMEPLSPSAVLSNFVGRRRARCCPTP